MITLLSCILFLISKRNDLKYSSLYKNDPWEQWPHPQKIPGVSMFLAKSFLYANQASSVTLLQIL